MNILAIDTSSTFCAVALRIGEVIHLQEEERGWHHLQNLMPSIKQLLAQSQSTLKDVDLFVCSDGPGSFTGLRIGFATIKGLMAATSLPYVHVTMLDVYRHYYACQRAPRCILIPITKRRVIVVNYSDDHASPLLHDIELQELPAYMLQLHTQYNAPITLCIREHDMLEVVKKLIADTSYKDNVLRVNIESIGTIAESLIAAGEDRFRTQGADHAEDQPTYFRLIDAELSSSAGN